MRMCILCLGLLTARCSNLIKKIREMSEAKTPLLGPGGGEERPQAVRRAA
jgi:hypothetical protein